MQKVVSKYWYCFWMNELSWFLAWELSSTYPTLFFKEIWVPPKIRVLPSGTLSQILDLDNFPHSKLILLSTKLVSGRACSTTTVDTPWLVTTHWSAITALLLFVMLVGRQEGHPACKNTVLGCWCGCLSGASADLHIAQLMPLPLTFSCFRLVLPFWYRLTWVVPEKGLLNGCVLLLLYNLFLQLCSS